MKLSHVLDLAWRAAIVIASLLLADYAMAQTPAGWNGRGPFIAFGRVWPAYIAPPAGRRPPEAPRLSFVPSPAQIAPAATPAPPPVRQTGKRPMPWGPFERTPEDGGLPTETD